MNRKLLIWFILLTGITHTVMAQADKWAGTWQMSSKRWPHIPAIILELKIGAPERGVLYPAKIKLQYGSFTGIYEVLLARKNDQQLGIGRGKYPLLETPFKLGIWMWYINGTLNFQEGKISVKRMWIDGFGIWMRGLDDDELYTNTKVQLREFLYRDSITLKKISSQPLEDSSVRRILRKETSDIYLGIYDPIMAGDSMITMQVEDQEKHDKDTVTLLHNNRTIFSRQEINDQNRRQQIKLDTGRNLFVFFADNYGRLPPNTGNLYTKIGEKEYSFDFRHRANAFATFVVADIYYKQSAQRESIPLASIKVDTANIVLELWDSAKEDGDSISLRLNGEWIRTGFPVKNALQKIPIRLQPGENTLLFMADNLGSIPPNTAELRIRYGTKSKNLRLSTDMKKNNEIRLILE
ncbi:hypothetical protein GFS24_25975 [Chitinophaga sp. SYP-B3965]|uniref:hypothetical protein n=1 Tax=Chitinophaga sp. SYP-B3965 TaxID=2663120 RepID=UPI0012996675|nr:hypothetical protein [Chitinophaga sp. SYP-B3965]MRG48592.1 hypothetical protein [Chitinophaga sp. SYP-B3965]